MIEQEKLREPTLPRPASQKWGNRRDRRPCLTQFDGPETMTVPRPLRDHSMILSRSWLLAVPLALTVGCAPPEEIKTYRLVRSTEPKATEKQPPDAGPTKSRLLGAIIPVGPNSSRFVKASGPAEKIDPIAEDFAKFVASIRVANDPANPVTYTAPAGWQPGPAKQMRLTTFLAGPGKVEVYISDPFGGKVLDNVNRWRKEVGAKEIGEAELAAETKPIQLGDVTATLIDVSGTGGKSGMMPPFAK